MTTPKGAAKAAPAKKAAREKAQAIAVVSKDWPPNITREGADTLFQLVSSGDFTVKSAAPQVVGIDGKNLTGETVYQWKRRFPKFGEELDEAIDIGCYMAEDAVRDIKAHDRDSAAGANIAITVLDKYLARKRPDRYHTNPFKASAGAGDSMFLGVVVVPAKQARLPDDTIEAEFTQIDVPAKVPA